MPAYNPPPASYPRPATRRLKTNRSGLAQLSLIEHALCSLDPALSLRQNYRHETGYFYTRDGNRRFANVAVSAALGLSSRDEYFLWGLLALTFNQAQPSIEFLATPHYCLKKLGYFEGKGGKQYADGAVALHIDLCELRERQCWCDFSAVATIGFAQVGVFLRSRRLRMPPRPM